MLKTAEYVPDFKKENFIKNSVEALEGIYDLIKGLPSITLDQLDPQKTALVIIDMVNGFAREGALYSARIAELIAEITRITERCIDATIPIIAFLTVTPMQRRSLISID